MPMPVKVRSPKCFERRRWACHFVFAHSSAALQFAGRSKPKLLSCTSSALTSPGGPIVMCYISHHITFIIARSTSAWADLTACILTTMADHQSVQQQKLKRWTQGKIMNPRMCTPCSLETPGCWTTWNTLHRHAQSTHGTPAFAYRYIHF